MNISNTFVHGTLNEKDRRNELFPLLKQSMEAGESFLVTNSGGTLIDCLFTDLIGRHYKIIYMDFSDIDANWCWNPLSYSLKLYKNGEIDNSVEHVRLISNTIMQTDSVSNKKDPFWANAASGLFEALTLSLFKNADFRDVNLMSILDMAIEGAGKSGNLTILHDYFELQQCKEFKKPASTFLNAPNETRASILSVFIQAVSEVVGYKQFNRHMMTNDIHVPSIVREKTALIINLSESSRCNLIIGLLVAQICFYLINENESYKSNRNFSFYFDRFVNIGRIPQIEKYLSYGIDFGFRFVMFVDNIAMLDNIYGKDVRKIIFEYCSKWIIYNLKDQEFIEQIDKMLDFYAQEQKVRILNALRNNKPIAFGEDKTFEVHYVFGEDLFPDNSSKWTRERICLPEPEEYSIIKFIRDNKTLNLFPKPQGGGISEDGKSSLNVENIIREIDKKIQEIEEEERKRIES